MPKPQNATPAQPDTGYDPDLDTLPDDDEPVRAAALPPAKPPATDKATEGTDAPAAGPEHSPRLVNLALSLGVPQAKIDSWDADRLEETVELLTLQALAAQRDANRTETLSRTATPPPVAPAPPPDEEIDLGFDTTGWDEQTVKALQAFAKKQREPLKATQAEVQRLREQEQARTVSTVFEAIEDAFAALPEGYHAALGKGELADLDEEAQALRKTIVSKASKDYLAATGRQLENATARQIKAQVEKAATKMFGKFVPAPAPPVIVTAGVDDEDEPEEPVESYPVQNNPVRQAPAQDPKTGRIVSPAAAVPKSQIDEQVARFRGGKVAVPTNRVNAAEGKRGRAKAEATAAAYLAQMNGSVDDGE